MNPTNLKNLLKKHIIKYRISMVYLILMLCLSSCTTKNKKEDSSSEKMQVTSEEKEMPSQKKDVPSRAKNMDKADSLVVKTIDVHGGELYDTAYFGFKFRDKKYTFHNKNGSYTYTVTSQKDGDKIEDVLEDGQLTRRINGTETRLSPKDIAKYTEALNSVVYFATLPHKLGDPAVNTTYEGQTKIRGHVYDVLAVTFDQEGGGVDHDDHFRYWINATTKTVDYLAYSYETNDGGVRFRSAYNPRTVGGIRFQDYVNFEAPIGTPLDELPERFEAKKLKELSRIETKDIIDFGK